MKKLIIVVSIIVFVLIIGLVVILVIRDKNSRNGANEEVKHFCEIMCAYNSDSSVWQFDSENAGLRSFPTKDECFVFCKTYKKDFNL